LGIAHRKTYIFKSHSRKTKNESEKKKKEKQKKKGGGEDPKGKSFTNHSKDLR
jgi:hypothetical protein